MRFDVGAQHRIDAGLILLARVLEKIQHFSIKAQNKTAHPRSVVGCERTLFGQQERKYSRGTQGVAQEFAKHRGRPVKLDAALVCGRLR